MDVVGVRLAVGDCEGVLEALPVLVALVVELAVLLELDVLVAVCEGEGVCVLVDVDDAPGVCVPVGGGLPLGVVDALNEAVGELEDATRVNECEQKRQTQMCTHIHTYTKNAWGVGLGIYTTRKCPRADITYVHVYIYTQIRAYAHACICVHTLSSPRTCSHLSMPWRTRTP